MFNKLNIRLLIIVLLVSIPSLVMAQTKSDSAQTYPANPADYYQPAQTGSAQGGGIEPPEGLGVQTPEAANNFQLPGQNCHPPTATEQWDFAYVGVPIPGGQVCQSDLDKVTGGCPELPYPYLFTKYRPGSQSATEGKNGILKLNADFACRLYKFFKAADAQGKSITITSAYRSTQSQQVLWNAALQKYGSAAAARKWVAPPGNSMHNKGLAADLGLTVGDAQTWAHTNANSYQLTFRLSNEAWHIEPSTTVKGFATPFFSGTSPDTGEESVAPPSGQPIAPPNPGNPGTSRIIAPPNPSSPSSNCGLLSIFGCGNKSSNNSGGLGNMMQMMMGMQLAKGLFGGSGLFGSNSTPAPAPAQPSPLTTLTQPTPIPPPVQTTPTSGTTPIDQLLNSLNGSSTNINSNPTPNGVAVQVSTTSVGQIAQPTDINNSVISSSTLATSSSVLQGQLDTISLQLQQATASIAIASSSGSPSAVTGALSSISDALSSIKAFLASLIGR